MGELIGASPIEEPLFPLLSTTARSFGQRAIESRERGGVLQLEFEKAKGFVPLLVLGQPSTDLSLCFPGSGVPSSEINRAVHNYYLKWLVQSECPWAILALNWPGYGQGDLNSNISFEGVSPYSWEEKATIMLSLANWAAKTYQPERISIVTHSTSAGVALAFQKKLLEINGVSEVFACSPSGIGADGTETRFLAQVAKKYPRLFQAILKGQTRLPSGLVNMLTNSSYGLPKGLLGEDPWIREAIEQTDPGVLWQEMAVEARPRKIDPLDPRVRVVVGGKDPMVLAGKLQQILEWQEPDHQVEVIEGAGHLFHREPEAIQQWISLLKP